MYKIKIIILLSFLLFNACDEGKENLIVGNNESKTSNNKQSSCSNPYSNWGNDHNIALREFRNYFTNSLNHQDWHEDIYWQYDSIPFFQLAAFENMMDELETILPSNGIDSSGLSAVRSGFNDYIVKNNYYVDVSGVRYIPFPTGDYKGYLLSSLFYTFNPVESGDIDKLTISNNHFNNQDYLSFYQHLDTLDICAMDTINYPLTLKTLAIYDSSYSFWSNLYGSSIWGKGNYPNLPSTNTKQTNTFQELSKEDNIRIAEWEADLLAAAADIVSAPSLLGAVAFSGAVLTIKAIVIADLEDCLCETCGKRLTNKEGC